MSKHAHLRSLQGRLLIASAVILPLVMLLAGFALSRAYHDSLENAVQERLQLQVYLLLGAVDLKEQHIQFPERLPEPRYDQTGSGLYAAIHDQNGALLWRSLSTLFMDEQQLSAVVDTSVVQAGEPKFEHLGPKNIYRYQLRIIWEDSSGERALLFTVMETDAQLLREVSLYNHRLSLWLSIIFLVALLAQTLILRWGLMPLRHLAKDIKLIESGESAQLSGIYPQEVTPVTENLNLLIDSERQQRERYRNTLGDLAHSLKTPLAVMRGAKHEEHDLTHYQVLVDEQVERMDQIVQYQLSRAVKTHSQPLNKSVPIAPLVERILGALQKVYHDKPYRTTAKLAPELSFAGDERDLMEMLGNILENAFKYGDHQVEVTGGMHSGYLELRIYDDGPGVPIEQRRMILQRGERLDTSIQGQGIGLSVVTDIISSYQGELEVTDSPLGGCGFIIRLPI